MQVILAITFALSLLGVAYAAFLVALAIRDIIKDYRGAP